MSPGVTKCLEEPFSESRYGSLPVNEDVVLYEGKIRVPTASGGSVHDGVVFLRFMPQIELHYRIDYEFFPPEPNDDTIYLEGIGATLPQVLHDTFQGNVDFFAAGQKADDSARCISRVNFHVADAGDYSGQRLHINEDNYHNVWFGRASFTFGKWFVRLDTLPDIRNRHEKVLETNGHGVTHLGCLIRSDGRMFSAKEAKDTLDFIYFFLSFVNGSRVSVLLAEGVNDKQQAVWNRWRPYLGKPYRKGTRWFPNLHPEEGFAIAAEAYTYWSDPSKRSWFTFGINLYTDSTRNNGGSEVELAKACIVVEMLASVVLVEERGRFTQADFDDPRRYPAAVRLKHLLRECGIPTTIPPKFSALASGFSHIRNDPGPSAVVQIRNAAVHMKVSNRARLVGLDPLVRFQAWYVSLWYIELVMLHLFGYQGLYENRCDFGRVAGTYEKVPWAI